MTRRQFYGAALIVLLLVSTAARAVNWPSASGTTAPGVVIENGSGGLSPASGGSNVVTTTARGGSITLGGTSQTLLAANASRKAFTVQNPCLATEQGIATAENLYINITSAATVSTNANLAVLPPCSAFSIGITAGVLTQEAVTVISATTSHIFYAKEFQ